MTDSPDKLPSQPIAFIGGGNMASAIIGGLIRQGLPPAQIEVVEPFAQARDKLKAQFGMRRRSRQARLWRAPGWWCGRSSPRPSRKPRPRRRPHTGRRLHLSVAAGIRSDSIAQWLGTQRIVRSMPNTPALIGKGMTALYARPGVSQQDKARVEQVIATTGESLWVDAGSRSSTP